eukprot:5799752-Pleurochrysis_carterae.AAC.1
MRAHEMNSRGHIRDGHADVCAHYSSHRQMGCWPDPPSFLHHVHPLPSRTCCLLPAFTDSLSFLSSLAYLHRFDDPSLLAYGLSGPKQFLYRVRFAQRAVWPEAESPHDTVDVDVYESWLLPAADGADTHCFTTEHYGAAVHEHEHAHGGSDDHGAEKDTSRVEGAIHSHHGDDLSDHAHVHLSRAEIEQNAISAEGAPRPGSAVHEALVNIVSAKGLVSDPHGKSCPCLSRSVRGVRRKPRNREALGDNV